MTMQAFWALVCCIAVASDHERPVCVAVRGHISMCSDAG